MAYRSREYVPQIHEPNDSRLSELIYLQGQNQAQQMRQQGANNALMWQGIGRAGSGMLSDLAQYKREEPARREAERVRKEQDKLRGLEQMAGAGGMDEQARGELLKREGFTERGQEILDKDVTRRATKATYDAAAKERAAKEMSELTFSLDQVRESADPVSAYASVVDSLKKKYGDKVADLPDTYDKPALDAYVSRVQGAADVAARNARAEHSAKLLEDKKNSFENHVKAAIGTLAPLAPKADTPEEWGAMWKNLDAYLADFTPEERTKIEARIPFPRQFSPQAHQQAVELERGPDKDPTSAWGAAMDLFRGQNNGRNPTTRADETEFNRILTRMTSASHVPTGGGVDARQQAGRKYQANKEKNDKLFDLEMKFKNGEIDETMLGQGKEAIQQWYLSTIGAEGGPTLAQIEGDRGRDVIGRPLSAQAQPGAARPQQPQQPMVLMQSPDGQEIRPVPATDAQYYVNMGGRVVRGNQAQGQPPAPPLGAPATPPPVAPVGAMRPNDAGPVAPPLPTTDVVMQSPRGRMEYVGPGEIEARLNEGWKILPPPTVPGAAAVKDIGSRIWRDLTTGAPPRQPATPRR